MVITNKEMCTTQTPHSGKDVVKFVRTKSASNACKRTL